MASIRVLDLLEAKKIAAGEVVDRPASLVREFMDNAIDSGASEVDVCIEEGGLKCTEVIDNGCGMSQDDLELCCYKHATSKITCLGDLQTLKSLGFRGEALAAAAASAYLEINSSVDGKTASRLTSRPDGNISISNTARTKGTTVKALYLFDTIPARKLFLKSPQGEAALCKKIFCEKAMAFHHISFRFYQDGDLKLDLPAVDNLKKRFSDAAIGAENATLLHEIMVSDEHFSARIIVGGPQLSKNNRRYQFIFANGRRINDFALQQALEYGTVGWFPNGTHPVGAIFIEIEGKYADFNVHPAKIEVRFADPGVIHHKISISLRNFVQEYEIKAGRTIKETTQNEIMPHLDHYINDSCGLSMGTRNENAAKKFCNGDYDFAALPVFNVEQSEPKYSSPSGLKYIGRVFELFIIVEKGEKLFVIDQHAAHERLLFQRVISGNIATQELLVPLLFQTDSDSSDNFLKSKKEDLRRLGLVIDGSDHHWEITALPAIWNLSDSETVKKILDLERSSENFAERWASTVACHAAIKDGTYLDNETALALANDALNLDILRCPHGRPFVTEINRDFLFKAVKRA
ncbi:MAG: DNA mismatch repair endonuclease MutL [Termitinemataceae bacterium]|nr:MAG: DNA mismatch repair endonuclease MutL [Termitinemataceae bacterium]